jgi:hypothetical protein
MAKKPTKRQSLDAELIRIQGILRLMDETQKRWFSLRNDLGESAYKRAVEYIKSRVGWQLRKFNNEQPLP